MQDTNTIDGTQRPQHLCLSGREEHAIVDERHASRCLLQSVICNPSTALQAQYSNGKGTKDHGVRGGEASSCESCFTLIRKSEQRNTADGEKGVYHVVTEFCSRSSFFPASPLPTTSMQAAAAPFSHGEMIYIHELDGVSHAGRSVRTLGRCIAYDTEHQTVDLEHNKKTLRVDVSLVEEQFPFAVGGMFQVIGEVCACHDVRAGAAPTV
jgi:hypothetical protein